MKIQSGPLNCNSEKILYLLRGKICDDTPYAGKTKDIDDWEVTLFEKCETYKQLKEWEKF